MDTVNIRQKAADFLKKYKYVAIILLVGIAFMLIPIQKENNNTQQNIILSTNETTEDIKELLEDILSDISGAGKVRVMLTVAAGEEIVYQSNSKVSQSGESSNEQKDTVTVTDTDRNQQGLIKRTNAPIYRGAIVVCQGADSAPVRLAIVEAVSKVTGLTADRITVLKMK